MTTLVALRLPLPWDAFGFPNPLATSHATLLTGEPAWTWDGDAPDLGIPAAVTTPGIPKSGWDLDHVVLLVPSLDDALTAFAASGVEPRLRMELDGRPAAYLRPGPLVEMIEAPVRDPAIFGVALWTDEPLEVVALRWRGMGLEVTDPRPALQPGRRIMNAQATEAGLAVMSPDTAAPR